MKKGLAIILAGIISLGVSKALGQDEKPLITPNTTAAKYSELAYDDFYYNAFGDIKENDLGNSSRLIDKLTIERAINAIEAYEGEEVKSNKYKDKSILEIYGESMAQEVKKNPPSSFDIAEDYTLGDNIYTSYIWNPMGVAARRKYEIVRKIGRGIEKVQDATSVKYKDESSGFIFNMRPFVNNLRQDEISVRGKIGFKDFNFSYKVGTDKFRAAVNLAQFNSHYLRIYFEYGHDFETNERTFMLKTRMF
jgi:hypothetical protein